MFLLILLISLAISQNSNITFRVLETKDTSKIKAFQGQLYAVPNAAYPPTTYHVNQYDLSLGVMAQAFTTNQTVHTIEIFNQMLFVGKSLGIFTFDLPINNFQLSPYKTYSNNLDVLYICMSDLYIITSPAGRQLVKWDIKTFQPLEYVTNYALSTINYAMIHGNSLFLSARQSMPVAYPYEIQEYNMTSLSQMIASYYVDLNYLFKLEIVGNNLFAGADSASVYQWNIQTKKLVRSFYVITYSLTQNVFDLEVSGDYIFAGMYGRIIQYQISTGIAYREVTTNIKILSVVLLSPVLFVAGFGGIIAYKIPELNGNYSFDNWLLPIAHTTTQHPSATVEAVTTLIASSVISSSDVLTWIAPTITPSLTVNKPKKTFQQSQQTNQTITIETLIPYIIVAFVFILLIFILVYYLLHQKVKKNSNFITSTTTTTTSTENTSSQTIGSVSVSTTESSSNHFSETTSYSDSKTLFTTQNIYSIPGYLNIQSEEVRYLKQIAKGGQGTIFLGELLNPVLTRKHDKTVIIKTSDKKFHDLSERQQNSFMQEVSMIHYFRDWKGIVDILGFTLEPAAMILKYYPYGSMNNLQTRKGSFVQFTTSKNLIIVFLYEISTSIALLHDAGFVHCDLKPQNILLEQDPNGVFHPILTDFGITQIVTEKVMKVKAMTIENLKGFSLHYAAPEQIKQIRDKVLKPLHPNVMKMRDIYAIGGILYSLMMRKDPWL